MIAISMFDSTLCNERQLTQDSLFMSPVSFQTVSIILGVGLISMTVRESTFLVGYTFRELFTQQRLFRFNDPELVKILQQAKQYSRTQRQD
jgi:hypothetical protein